MRYILKDGWPVLEPNLKTWEDWYRTANRIIKLSMTSCKAGGLIIPGLNCAVVTQFEGVDMRTKGEGWPLLYSTKVYADGAHTLMARCLHMKGTLNSTLAEAMVAHGRWLKNLATALDPTTKKDLAKNKSKGLPTFYQPMMTTQPKEVLIRGQRGSCDEGR